MSASPVFFVAGATGYVGRELVSVIRKHKKPCFAHVREGGKVDSWRQTFSEMGAQTVVSSWDEADLRECLSRCQPAIVCAVLGTTKDRAKAEGVAGDIYQTVDYGLTKLLIDGCLALENPPRFVYLSSIGASPYSRSPYLRARGQVEADLEASGLSYVTAQPAIITGPDRDQDRPLERFGAKVGDTVLRIGSLFGGKSLQQTYQSTSPAKLANALYRLALSTHRGVAAGGLLRETLCAE